MDPSSGTVISKDGTRIGFRRVGSGPGVILVQGAMGGLAEFSELAAALSAQFTVCVPERRGRGLSPLTFRDGHTIERDVEDLEAMLAHSGARRVFALSSGAVIALTAAASGAPIELLAAFEPPLFSSRPVPSAQLARFERAIAKGDVAAALTAAGKAVALVPALEYLPSWLLTFFVRRALASERKNPVPGEPTLGEIALSLQYDLRIVNQMAGPPTRWKDLKTQTLLLGGALSPAYLAADLDALAAVLPHAQRVVLPGLDHGASWNLHPQRNRKGNPDAVAVELRRFFAGP